MKVRHRKEHAGHEACHGPVPQEEESDGEQGEKDAARSLRHGGTQGEEKEDEHGAAKFLGHGPHRGIVGEPTRAERVSLERVERRHQLLGPAPELKKQIVLRPRPGVERGNGEVEADRDEERDGKRQGVEADGAADCGREECFVGLLPAIPQHAQRRAAQDEAGEDEEERDGGAAAGKDDAHEGQGGEGLGTAVITEALLDGVVRWVVP